jgi:hypothetical protein
MYCSLLVIACANGNACEICFKRTWSVRVKSSALSPALAAATLLFVMVVLPPLNATILGTRKADEDFSAWFFDQQSDCAKKNAATSKHLMKLIGICGSLGADGLVLSFLSL